MEEINNQNKQCEACENNNATLLCMNCYIYLCDDCSKYLHSKKPKSEHILEKADKYNPIDIKCEKHKNDALGLFCVEDKGKSKYLI